MKRILGRENQERWAAAIFLFLIVLLWIAGGGSRADIFGQTVTRLAAWATIIAIFLVGHQPNWRSIRPIVIVLGASISIAAIQLIPLPPDLWLALPGREIFGQAAIIAGEPQPWRPISISPSYTLNALYSLVVPVSALLAIANLGSQRQRLALTVLLLAISGAATMAVFEFAGGVIDNPLLNKSSEAVSANFANRNHFALFLAIGCVLAPVWAFSSRSTAYWKVLVATTAILVFELLILGSGSRAGIILGAMGAILGLLITKEKIAKFLSRFSRKLLMTAAAMLGLVLVSGLMLSVTLGRAVSIERVIELDPAQDMRARALPTVIEMIQLYFPFGSGLGAFDPVFRISEPDELLAKTYLNHVHNDWLEIVLDAGLPGLILLVFASAWWGISTIAMIRQRSNETIRAGLAGSAIVGLTMVASLTDYPARTPMIMAALAIGAYWMALANRSKDWRPDTD